MIAVRLLYALALLYLFLLLSDELYNVAGALLPALH